MGIFVDFNLVVYEWVVVLFLNELSCIVKCVLVGDVGDDVLLLFGFVVLVFVMVVGVGFGVVGFVVGVVGFGVGFGGVMFVVVVVLGFVVGLVVFFGVGVGVAVMVVLDVGGLLWVMLVCMLDILLLCGVIVWCVGWFGMLIVMLFVIGFGCELSIIGSMIIVVMMSVIVLMRCWCVCCFFGRVGLRSSVFDFGCLVWCGCCLMCLVCFVCMFWEVLV